MIRVLIVDDSSIVREALKMILENDPEMEVVGMAAGGREALSMVVRLSPDVITMDFQMPDMDGLTVTRKIMEEHPTPIVIVSAVLDPEESVQNFKALEAGALAVLQKPRLSGDDLDEADIANITDTVKIMSEVRVVRRRAKKPGTQPLAKTPQKPKPAPVASLVEKATPNIAPAATPLRRETVKKITRTDGIVAVPNPPGLSTFKVPKAVVLGTSTGGPQALQRLLPSIPASFPYPILIVQHIAKGFLPGLLQWLQGVANNPIHVAQGGEKALPGHIYFAPDDVHMGVDKSLRIALSSSKAEHSVRPAVSHLFRSACTRLDGRVAAVLLTGMGRDGAQEMLQLKEMGAHTIAQDQESSIIHGMPGAAIALGGASRVLPLLGIGPYLVKIGER